MLYFILRWVRGLILGWVMALLFSLIKRIIARAFAHNDLFSQKPSSDPHASNTAYDPDVIDTIWIGMPITQLISHIGAPASKKPVSNSSEEIWHYASHANFPHGVDIIVGHDCVKNWTPYPAPRLEA